MSFDPNFDHGGMQEPLRHHKQYVKIKDLNRWVTFWAPPLVHLDTESSSTTLPLGFHHISQGLAAVELEAGGHVGFLCGNHL